MSTSKTAAKPANQHLEASKPKEDNSVKSTLVEPGVPEKEVKQEEKLKVEVEPKVDLFIFKKFSEEHPDYNIKVNVDKLPEVEVLLVHKSTPESVHEATGIHETLRKSDGKVGPHHRLLGTMEDVVEAIKKADKWINL